MHLTIQKRRVTASNASRSGVGYQDWTGDKPSAPPAPAAAPLAEPKPTSAATPVPVAVAREDRAVDSLDAFLKTQVQPSAPAVPATERPEKPAKGVGEPRTDYLCRHSSYSPPPPTAPAPINANSIQKMKDLGMYRNQYFKDADCFDCGHKFKTSRSARSASCPACGAHISLEDVEINMNTTQPVKTRGDVIIRKRGHLSASSLQCRDLRCFGNLEANVECGGDAIFKATGTVIGEIRCRRFIVERGADLVFKNPIRAQEVEIHARIAGTIFSSGPMLIGTYGAVNGDVTARSVSIEPGGELNGAMNIVRAKPASPVPGMT
ncbi:MAG: hypothetical protein RIS79_3129 [Verrucomicrobiota bacterium]|jgi:cytoskeletal protein CcmA (bactofilin family)/ribosomal protein S27E